MKISDFFNLVRRHIILLLVTPILLASLVALLTQKSTSRYASETTLYTGIASGSSVEMDKSFNYQVSNTAFDNLIGVIQSRETQQEVAIRLLAKHLMLVKSDPRYLSNKSFEELKRITPDYIKSMVVRPDSLPNKSEIHILPSKKDSIKPELQKHIVKSNETLVSISRQYNISVADLKQLIGSQTNKIKLGQSLIVGEKLIAAGKDSTSISTQEDRTNTFSFTRLSSKDTDIQTFSESRNQIAYEKTVSNLTQYMLSNDTNFVFKLLNYVHPHYSIHAISSINTQRITNSDLIQLKYESDDPGICLQTLVILSEVCTKNYKNISKNRSGDVVKYFEYKAKQAEDQLKIAEEKLLKFNTDNNIINYNEQSKTVALKKEDLDVEYNNSRVKLAGVQAVIQRLEEKLGNQHQMLLNNSNIIEKRNQLVNLNYKIASAETMGSGETADQRKLVDLKARADKLKEEISLAVNQLYSSTNSTDGLPISKLLNDWINNIIEAENIKAGMKVLSQRIKEFKKQYDVYVPAGSNIKKIEREISVAEQQYLDILRNLNLAKLKMQDNELASIIKTVDPPYYPLSPIPSKRNILILFAGFLGFMMVLFAILALEFFNNALSNPTKAGNTLKLTLLGVFPKISPKKSRAGISFISDRLLNIIIQNIDLNLIETSPKPSTKTILFFSTMGNEGKSVVMGNLAYKLSKQGKNVLVLSTLPDSDPVSSGVDAESPYLSKLNQYLGRTELFYYSVNKEFVKAMSYLDIIEKNNNNPFSSPDYVFIELPSILYNSYPVGLLSNADLSILVCRSNRSWSEADQGALERVSKFINKKIPFILNGVEMPVVRSILGESIKFKNGFQA